MNQKLIQLLQRRFGGATNIAGIRYQLLYSVLRAFDLYQPDAPEVVAFEGIEDVDLQGLQFGNLYVQVKWSNNKQGLSWLKQKKLLERFAETYLLDSRAHFLLVTNFGFKGSLATFAQYCNRNRADLPGHLRKDLRRICQGAGLPQQAFGQLVRRISFQQLSEEQVLRGARAAIIEYFDVAAGNEELYLMVLFSEVADRAMRRTSLSKKDLEVMKLRIRERISLGPVNPAVQQGLITPLVFEVEPHPEDYYEGKNARPGHIVADLDAPRPDWIRQIKDVFSRVRVCVLRASSGQGKSTLLYRYAYEHYHPDTTFILRTFNDESMLGPLKQFLQAYLTLGLPLLVLIDNLSLSTRYWHRLVGELAGEDVFFLVATREEDWYRYAEGESKFVWETITPEMSLDEARRIFAYFQHQGRIASNVPSAEWAYEQVAERRLLIEFVYLITQGQMLAERLEGQIRTMDRLREDRAKLQVLRLVSVAQSHGARIRVSDILALASFQGDPQATLASLEREYILRTDGYYEGLHFIRSKHLVKLLHDPVPLEQTLNQLIPALDIENLEALITNAFASSNLDHEELLKALVRRARGENVAFINRCLEALFYADESLYFYQHKELFDRAFQLAGPPALFMLTASTLPASEIDIVSELAELLGGRTPHILEMRDMARRFTPRGELGHERLGARFLGGVESSLNEEKLLSDLSQLADLATWYAFYRVDSPSIREALGGQAWEPKVYTSSADAAAVFLKALFQLVPARYREFLRPDKERLFGYFKLLTETPTIWEEEQDIRIEFIVDESSEVSPHDQALSRLQSLHQFFPVYEHYCSKGLYPALVDMEIPVDDTRKAIPADTLQLSLDAKRNSIYMKIVDNHYAAKLIHDWAQRWDQVRRQALALVEGLIRGYQLVYRGRQFNTSQLNPLIAELDASLRIAPKLPKAIEEQFARQQKAMEDWRHRIGAFVRQYSEHDPNDGNAQTSRLMRYNLREALKVLPGMQSGFETILRAEGQHLELPGYAEQELRACEFLADLLDFWFEQPRRRVRDLRATVRMWKQSWINAFAQAVRVAMEPLMAQGLRFHYPTGPLIDHPLVSLCLAYEVLDFAGQNEQLALILGQLAEVTSHYDFAYLTPVINGRPLWPKVHRVGRDKIQQLVTRMVQDYTWAILLVNPPADMFDLLPSLQNEPLPETALVVKYMELRAALLVLRNKVLFLKSRLNPTREFEAILLEKQLRDCKAQEQTLFEQIEQLKTQGRQFATVNIAADEWAALWTYAFDATEALRGLTAIDVNRFAPQAIGGDPEFDALLASYMNARYLQ